MGLSIGPVIGVEGAEKFQLAFKEMAAAAGMLQSQMDAVTASFRDNDSAMKTNKAVREQLTKQVSQQQRIYDKSVEGYTKAKQAVVDAAKGIVEAKAAYERWQPVLATINKQLDDATEAEKRQAQAVNDAQRALDAEKAKLQEMKAAYSGYKRDLEQVQAQHKSNATNIENALKAEEKNLDRVTKSFGENSKQAQESRERIEELTKELNNEREILKGLKEELDRAKKAHGYNSEAVKEQQQRVAEADAELKKQEKTYDAVKAELKSCTKATKEAAKVNETLARNVETSEKRLDVAKVTAQKWGDVMYTAKAKLEEFKKALHDLPGKLVSFAEDVGKAGEAMVEFGEEVTKILSPFTALTTFAAKGASDFTDSLAKISTIADTSKVSLDEFGTGIKQLASDTGFATDDIAAAVYQALSAAVKTEDALEFTAGAADLARAGFLDMFGSVDVLTTILNAYHKDVSEVSHISDVLVKVQDRGKTTVNELAQAMGNVIPTAAQYGISLEDLGAAYVVLTKQGINTARTTTYLRSAFTELEKAESDSSKALQAATGKTFMQLMKDGKSLGEIMQILKDSVGGNEEAFIHLFGSIRTAAGALALANTSAYEYAEILDDVSNSNGQAARNVEKLQTPSLKLKKIWEQLKTSGIDLGQQMLEMAIPALNKLANYVKKATDWFKGLNSTTKKSLAMFVATAGAIGPVIIGIGKLAIGFKKAIVLTAALLKGTASLLTAFNVFGAVIGVAIAGMAAYRVKLDEEHAAAVQAREAEWGLTEEMKERIEANKELVKESMNVRTATQELTTSNLGQAKSAETLLGQLRELYDKEGNVLKGKEAQAEFIKGSLADALGIEIGELDKQIEKYGILSGQIDNLIQKKLNEANAEAYLSGYSKQIQALSELQLARDAEYQDFVQKSKDRNKALEEAQLAFAAYKDAEERGLEGEELAEYAHAWSEAEANLKTAQSAMDESKASYEDLNRAIDEGKGNLEFYMEKYMETTGMTAEEAQKAAESAAGSFDETANKNKEAFDKINKDAEEGMAAYQLEIERSKDPNKRAGSTSASGTIEGMSSELAKTPSLAQNFIDSFYNTATSPANLAKMFDAGRIPVEASNKGAKEASKQGSPSRVWMDFANNDVEGYLIGANRRLGDMYAMGEAMSMAAMPTGWTSNYSRLPDYAYGTTNNTRNISAPIAVNVNVNGNVDDPNGLADIIEQRLVEKIINNERAFA